MIIIWKRRKRQPPPASSSWLFTLSLSFWRSRTQPLSIATCNYKCSNLHFPVFSNQDYGSCPILVINTEKGFKAEGRRQKAEVLKPLYGNHFGNFPSFFPSALCLLPYPNPDHQKLPRTRIICNYNYAIKNAQAYIQKGFSDHLAGFYTYLGSMRYWAIPELHSSKRLVSLAHSVLP